jgi:hypothetical protein
MGDYVNGVLIGADPGGAAAAAQAAAEAYADGKLVVAEAYTDASLVTAENYAGNLDKLDGVKKAHIAYVGTIADLTHAALATIDPTSVTDAGDKVLVVANTNYGGLYTRGPDLGGGVVALTAAIPDPLSGPNTFAVAQMVVVVAQGTKSGYVYILNLASDSFTVGTTAAIWAYFAPTGTVP